MLAPGCVLSLGGTPRYRTRSNRVSRVTEKQAELFRGKNWGTVVTLREDGAPHATPVWIDTGGENGVFNTAIVRAHERHLRRDPRGAVAVLPALLFLGSGHWILGLIVGVAAVVAVWLFMQARTVR